MLPTTIRIGHIDYRVLQATEPWHRETESYGITDPERGTITIYHDNQPLPVVLETLWHEVNHAINVLTNVTDKTDEEDQVRRTSPVWLQVFRDNPQFLQMVNTYAQA